MSRHGSTTYLSYGSSTDLHDMRRANRNRILRSIITRGPASRAELSRRTGMSRPTVSVIANELLTSGVLMEGDRVSSGGAPGTLLEIARDTGATLVVDLRQTSDVTMALVSPAGQIVRRQTASVTTEDDVLKWVEDFTAPVPRQSMVGAAIAVHGFVDPAGSWQNNPTGSLDVSIIDRLRRLLRMDVWPVNATDAITIADLRHSPEGLAAQATLVMRGVALGLIIGGNVLTGTRRPAGDVAHLVTGAEGPQCSECGRRCLFASTVGLYTDAGNVANQAHATRAVTSLLAPLCAALELEEIVLALLPASCAEAVRDQIRKALGEYLPEAQMPTVRLSEQGEDAVLIGAASMYLHKRLI